MKETELQNFIEENNESKKLEYKLKPNFNQIENTLKHIIKRMHFNILKTIYGFANTEGGELYVGIKEHEKNSTKNNTPTIEGVDNNDKKLIEGILTKVSPKITINKEFIKLKNGREVIKITVDKLKLYDKPQLLDGVLYIREGPPENIVAKTKKATTDEWKKIYFETNPYWLKGLRVNINQIKNEEEGFKVNLFFDGLKENIISFAKKNHIKDNEKIKKAEHLLHNIKKAITDAKNGQIKPFRYAPESTEESSTINIDKTIDDFINFYKSIIDMET